jgi:hypothetical protein
VTNRWRDARWLTRGRVQAYARILLLAGLALLAASIWKGTGPLPAAQDFAAFWTASVLALQGHPAEAYGEAARRAMVALIGPGTRPPFFYSPVALLLWLPLGLLPAGLAAALWVCGTAGAYAAAVRAVSRGPFALVALAYPAALICAIYGQNGLFSAALFGGVALSLGRAPILAGVLIGCLAYKPQLGLLAPLALLCARRTKAFASAAATVLLLALASAAVFGTSIWRAFVASLPLAQAWNAQGVPGFDRFASPYAAARLLGAAEPLGWAVQAAFALPAAAALVWVTRRRPGGAAETAMLALATCFCVPFLGEYDLVILAVTGAWIASDAGARGWLPYERLMLALLFLSPAAIKAGAVHGVPLAPAAMTVLGLMLVRRHRAFPPNTRA